MVHPTKPFAPSCDRNQQPILAVLQKIIGPQNKKLLEIGSGTGQHAVYFSPNFPQLEWVTSDVKDNHEGIRAWLSEASLSNVSGPLEIEIGKDKIPAGEFDFLFSANVLHIISAEKVKILLSMIGESLKEESQLIFYGPFNYNKKFTSQSNADFDRWLKDRNPDSGIRDFEFICGELAQYGYELTKDYEMPSNNRILHFWNKSSIG